MPEKRDYYEVLGVAQDANAVRLNPTNAASRAATKAGKLYSCGSWDLVDAIRNGQVDLAR